MEVPWFLWVLVATNGVGAILIVVDKARAQARKRRIPERTLWLAALLSGGILMALAMVTVRHKTRKPAFLLPFAIASLPVLVALAFALDL